MQITLSPQVSGSTLAASVSGDVLTVNGVDYDFSGMNDGDLLPPEAIEGNFVVGNVTKAGGVVSVTLRMPIDRTAPDSAKFPDPVTVTSGAVPLPPRSA